MAARTRTRNSVDMPIGHIDAPPETIDVRQPQNQLANAIAVRYADQLTWDESTKQWFQKEDVIWRVCGSKVVYRLIRQSLEGAEGNGYSYHLITALEKFMQIDLQLNEWVTDRYLLPLQNGVLNLRTRELEPYDDRKFNWILPYSYDPDATCPTVKRYLISTTNGERSVIRLLLAWMYAVLTGRYDLQKYIEAIGAGGTGKSTFQDLCTLLVGEENRVVTDLKKLERNRFESANLKHKLLALITDSSRYNSEVAMLKAVTGSDPLPFEKKGVQAGEPFVFTGMVMVAANEAIQSSDYTSGLARRKISVEFNHRVSDLEKQRYRSRGGIVEAMKLQLSGLLNWLLSLDESEVVNIINNPEEELMRQRIDSAISTNPVLGWLDESVVRCERGQESNIGNAGSGQFTCLFPNYVEWCRKQGREPMSLTRFSSIVLDNCETYDIDTTKHRGGSGNHLKGLRLRNTHVDIEIPTLIANRVFN